MLVHQFGVMWVEIWNEDKWKFVCVFILSLLAIFNFSSQLDMQLTSSFLLCLGYAKKKKSEFIM